MKHIIRSYRLQIRQLAALLNNNQGMIREGDIHRIRVCIKKIRAVRLFLHHINPVQYPIPKTGGLQTLFHSAGQLRETQLILHAFGNYPSSDRSCNAYVSFLKKEEIKQQAFFLDRLEHFWEAGISGLDLALPVPIHSNQLLAQKGNEFVRKHIKKLHKLCKKPIHQQQLHKIRKVLKTLDPVLELHKTFSDTPIRAGAIKKLKRAGKLIGLWHDQDVLHTSLKLFLRQHHSLETRKSVLHSRYKQIGNAVKKNAREVKKKTGKLVQSL